MVVDRISRYRQIRKGGGLRVDLRQDLESRPNKQTANQTLVPRSGLDLGREDVQDFQRLQSAIQVQRVANEVQTGFCKWQRLVLPQRKRSPGCPSEVSKSYLFKVQGGEIVNSKYWNAFSHLEIQIDLFRRASSVCVNSGMGWALHFERGWGRASPSIHSFPSFPAAGRLVGDLEFLGCWSQNERDRKGNEENKPSRRRFRVERGQKRRARLVGRLRFRLYLSIDLFPNTCSRVSLPSLFDLAWDL